MQNYKDIKAWQKAHQLTLEIYTLTKTFPKEEQFALTSQIKRASYSIAANIAEGCGKRSAADFTRFLNISLGSANETEYYLILAKDLHLIEIADYNRLYALVNEVKAMLISFIRKVSSS